ncbi:porphobilinogen deaminase [Deltaproteobacteria bacterium]|nr:porphobilinogen deaminase [Deltaproteobacteria bacterium]
MAETLKIGARGSPLSLAQTGLVARALAAGRPGLALEIIPIKTTGDKILDAPLARIGGKGLFVKEIEEALLAGAIDLAVHSAKDLPARLPDGLLLGATPARADFRDVLVTREPGGLEKIPPGARVGTSGLRRQAQLLARRPDLRITPIRGNLGTRLQKVGPEVEAVIVAAAGLARLGLSPAQARPLDPEEMLPAVGQGALALEIRQDDARTAEIVRALHHRPTGLALAAERGFLGFLGGGCQLPVAALAQAVKDREAALGRLELTALIADPSGRRVLRGRRVGSAETPAQAANLGQSLAAELMAQGGAEILERLVSA